MRATFLQLLLGGSWVVIGSQKSIIVTLLITPLITTHEPPSQARGLGTSRPKPCFSTD